MNKTHTTNNPSMEVYKEEPPGSRRRIERFDIPLEDLKSLFEASSVGSRKVRTRHMRLEAFPTQVFQFPL